MKYSHYVLTTAGVQTCRSSYIQQDYNDDYEDENDDADDVH